MPLTRSTAAAAAAVCAALLAGCSATKPPVVTPTSSVPAPPASASAPVARPAAVASVPDYLNPNSPVSSQRSLFFSFDDASLKPEDRSVVEVQGRYLAAHPAVAVHVEGNTDERGSAEYNLALGQRRAQAVANALKVYGVKDSQMEPVSWGEEKPRASGHDEAAWAQNRRADVVYPTH